MNEDWKSEDWRGELKDEIGDEQYEGESEWRDLRTRRVKFTAGERKRNRQREREEKWGTRKS